MMIKNISVALLATVVGSAYAANITAAIESVVPQQCASQCDGWIQSVGNCITNLNQDFSATINTSDLDTFAFTGDLSTMPACFCSVEAIAASTTCLQCATDNLCLEPAITSDDYLQICNNPMFAVSVFQRYHSTTKWDQCSASSGGDGSSGPLGGSNGGGQSGGSGSSADDEDCEDDSASSATATSTMYRRSRFNKVQ